MNGIDVDDLSDLIGDIQRDPEQAKAAFRTNTVWQGRARSETTVGPCTIGDKTVTRNFTVAADQPTALLGGDDAMNPQELLLAALSSCLITSFANCAAIKGVELDSIEVAAEGELDLRGYLGLDRGVAPGCETIRYTIRVRGDGTEQEFREVHDAIMATTPNVFNMTRPVALESTLIVD